MRLRIRNRNDVTSNKNRNDVTLNKNRNDVTLNYQTSVKWRLATLVQCQNNCYKVGTHCSFYFRLIISQTTNSAGDPYNKMI